MGVDISYVIEMIKARIEEIKKSIAEAEEMVRLGELMGIDVGEQRARLEHLKRQLVKYEEGLKRYLSQRSARS